jgi:hypothetical protein
MARTRVKTRDYNMVNVIKGATKAAIHVDRKKRANADSCRQSKIPLASWEDSFYDSVKDEEEEWDDSFTVWEA